MNSNTQFLPLPDPAPQALNQPQPPDRPDPAAPKRGRSKIDRLPRHLRERLNQLMDDGVPYSRILEQLGPEAAGITVSNLSDWFATGHQLWLKNQAWRDELHARMDAFQSLAANTNPTQLSRSGLLLSMLQICEQLRDLGPQVHQQQLQTDFNAYLRTLNTFARLSRSMIALLQFEQNSPPPPPDPLTEEEQRRLIIAKIDQILGLPPTRHTTAANPPPLTFNPQPPTHPAPQEQTSNINLGESAVETPVPHIPAEATPSSPIENQRLENQDQSVTIEPPTPNSLPEAAPSSPIENPQVTPASIENQKSKIENPLPGPELTPLAIENLKSKIENPLAIENPQRNSIRCQFCRTRAFPKQRRPWCRICGKPLPPPGQRFVTRCAACGSSIINVTNTGQRAYEHCPRCDAPIPFLEPAPPPSLKPR